MLAVAFSPDGQALATAGMDQPIRLWDVGDDRGQERAARRWHEGTVLSVAFTPDGKQLASGGEDGQLLHWDLVTGKQHAWNLPGAVRGVCFAPDGRHLATGNGNGTVYILRLAP
jgi:WD40 repeat protein